jgi:hypothetical protein
MDEQATFYPFHAINEFMRPDFRLSMVRDVLSHVTELPAAQANELAKAINKTVKIPGFRNSEKAPAMVKVLPTVKAFEKHPELVGVILSAWATIHTELQKQVFMTLQNRNWKIIADADDFTIETLSSDVIKQWPVLPLNIQRSRLPGFLPRWPKGEDFETIYTTFNESYPDSDASIDQVSLMAVWLSMRLPYQLEEVDNTTPDDHGSAQ